MEGKMNVEAKCSIIGLLEEWILAPRVYREASSVCTEGYLKLQDMARVSGKSEGQIAALIASSSIIWCDHSITIPDVGLTAFSQLHIR